MHSDVTLSAVVSLFTPSDSFFGETTVSEFLIVYTKDPDVRRPGIQSLWITPGYVVFLSGLFCFQYTYVL